MVVWDGEDMSPLHSRQLPSRAAPRDLWVTDAVLLPNANKVSVTPPPERCGLIVLSFTKTKPAPHKLS